MSKKLFTMFLLFATVFIFTGSSDLMGCHRYYVGLYHDSNGVVHGFLCTEQTNDLSKTWTYLTIPNANWTRARGVNNVGDVVGEYQDSNGDVHGFFYDRSAASFTYPIDFDANALGTTIHAVTTAYDGSGNPDHTGTIHYAGDYTDANGDVHGFFWDGTDFEELDYTDSSSNVFPSILKGINDDDDMVGNYTDNSSVRHGIKYDWTDWTINNVDIATAAWSVLFDINNDGDMVGSYQDSSGDHHGYMKSGSTYTYYNYPSAAQTWVTGNNNEDWLVGYYKDTSDVIHGFGYDPDNSPYYFQLNVPNATQTRITDVSDETYY